MPPPDETKYAIFLLNQNLTQLLVYTGQWPSDLRSTLANLMSLTKNVQLGENNDQVSLHRTPYIYGATSSSEFLSDDHSQAKDVEPNRALEAEHRK